MGYNGQAKDDYVGNMFTFAKDPNGNYIYFVTGNSDAPKTAQLNTTNFKVVLNYMNSTQNGAELINYYINNSQEDLYMTIAPQLPNNALGRTIQPIHPETGYVTRPEIKDGKMVGNIEPGMENFEGVTAIDPKAEIQLISFSAKDAFGDIDISPNIPTENTYKKKAAKAMGHEMGGHARNGGRGMSTEQQHKAWGQEHYTDSFAALGGKIICW